MKTTIHPAPHTHIRLNITLSSPFHHGAGTAGNTSILRTHEVLQPDGTVARVPFLSAASIRHALREAMAWETARLTNLPYHSLTKTAVDLLFTGGAVSSTGSRTDLAMIRDIEEHLPHLSLMGYAAKSDIITGTLRASDFILVCRENSSRLGITSERLAPAAHFRSEEFGTRHDQAASPAARYLEVIGSDIGTAQMIWDTQVLITGSQLAGEITLTPAATKMHSTALGAALHLWAPNQAVRIGAKTAQGYGSGVLYPADENAPEEWQQSYEQWAEHTTEHADDIHRILHELG